MTGWDPTIILIGLTSFALRAWRYHIHSRSIIAENLLYIVVVCLVIVPWLKETFDLEPYTTYIWAYFLAQSAKDTVDSCVDILKSKMKL